MSKNQLIIQVPPKPTSSLNLRRFTWPKNIVLDLDSDPVDRSVSRNIFGYESALTILKHAFKLGLSRDVEWDISQVDSYLRPSFLEAAKVFKRGVSVTGVTEISEHQTYQIHFCGDISEVFSPFCADDLFIVDSEIARFWWHRLPSGYVSFEFCERKKDIETLSEVLILLRQQRKKIRNVMVIGGGVAGDIVGFACGLECIPCHFVPTTLLSMVDSSIGGKVGINFEPWGKNQLGLFCSPASVQVWTGWLSTLDETEIKSGLVEALKHALLSGNASLWRSLITIAKTKRWSDVQNLISDIVSVKNKIVSRDPYERGERAVLNFGHTLGHAVETLMHRGGYCVSHGACVALGMIHALRVSGECSNFSTADLIHDILAAKLLPPEKQLRKILELPRNQILELMQTDKKNDQSALVRFVLLKGWGKFARSEDGSWTVNVSLEAAVADIDATFKLLKI